MLDYDWGDLLDSSLADGSISEEDSEKDSEWKELVISDSDREDVVCELDSSLLLDDVASLLLLFDDASLEFESTDESFLLSLLR